MIRKGDWWVETAGERVQRMDRFRLEYQWGDALYVCEVEPGSDLALYTDTLRRDGDPNPVPEPERQEITRRMLALLSSSGDPFTLA